jgi:protocatechuate 3,4-dioxygenase, beta subunit
MTKSILAIFFPLTILLYNCGQTQTPIQNHKINNTSYPNSSKDIPVGGACDRCEIMYEGMPPREKINRETTIANESEPGERMEINGTVFMMDSKTPAKDIILYIYHTNAKGYYAPSDTQTAGRRNGHLRGWVRTNGEGKFKFHSVRNAPYPNANIPAHIHILVKEPGKTLYYIDEVWYDDDPLVTKKLKDGAEKRGGDLVIHLTKNNDGAWKGNLNITLGLNIPHYK